MSDSDSDSENDLDYIPEDDGQSEESDSGEEEVKPASKSEALSRKRVGGIKLDNEEEAEEVDKSDVASGEGFESNKTEEKKKKQADSLWADFLFDVGKKPTGDAPVVSNLQKQISEDSKTKVKAKESPKRTEEPSKSASPARVTKIFDFAGEEVRVTSAVAGGSSSLEQTDVPNGDEVKANPTARCMLTAGMKRRGRGGGLGSVLDKINKKPKMSVLDKSKLDWDEFKHGTGIADELATHNRGKKGYIERQQFLQRTDLRQFEIEKSFRQANSKR